MVKNVYYFTFVYLLIVYYAIMIKLKEIIEIFK